MAAAEDVKLDLPVAWRAATAHCPFCSGTGKRERPPEDACAYCDATGDLLGAMLRKCYELGRDEALESMRALHADLMRAGRSVAAQDKTAEQLKWRMGLA